MQYLNKFGELFYPETPPIRSDKVVHTKHVIQQEDPGVKEPGSTRFVCLSDTHGLHVGSHSSSQRLQVHLPVSPQAGANCRSVENSVNQEIVSYATSESYSFHLAAG